MSEDAYEGADIEAEAKRVISQQVDEVAAVEDKFKRVRVSGRLLTEYHNGWLELARIRKEAVLELSNDGNSHAQIAEEVGLSRSRVGQIAKSGPSPERAFLGNGPLTAVIGLKREAGRDNPVYAQETADAFYRLQELAKTHQLEATMEPTQWPGLVDLNRDNLIVLGGPRLFPLVGQILQGDPHLRFEDVDGAWLLRDMQTGKEYRAPRDTGEPHDFGYLGRLPRPDGAGTFLCIAGLHATGTHGVCAFLETGLADLYSKVKTGRFSVVIECEYDPENRAITKTTQASPIHNRS